MRFTISREIPLSPLTRLLRAYYVTHIMFAGLGDSQIERFHAVVVNRESRVGGFLIVMV